MALSSGAKAVLAVLVLFLLVAGGIVAYASYLLGGEAGPGEPVTLEVPQGSSAGEVANMLEDEGVIRSSLAFRLKARSTDLDRALQAGRYELETGMSVDQAIAVMLRGPLAPEAVQFTIPEGLTVEETLARLAEQTPYTVEEYRQVLDQGQLTLPEWVPPLDQLPDGVREPYEGLLFPETYEVKQEATAQQILQRMVDELAQVVASVPDEDVAATRERGLSRYEALVLASLIEEEAQVAAERPTISGVIYNRLEADRALQIDASNLYAAGEKGRVTEQYLEIDSPYNLYQHVGLPPTPISAPGRSPILAAFAPEEHGFLYYVKKNEQGEHAFAETFEEHQRNVQRFRQLQREASEEATPTPGG